MQYNDNVLYVPTYFLYVISNIIKIIKLQILSTICTGNKGVFIGANTVL